MTNVVYLERPGTADRMEKHASPTLLAPRGATSASDSHSTSRVTCRSASIDEEDPCWLHRFEGLEAEFRNRQNGR